jgi:hypothetical protein
MISKKHQEALYLERTLILFPLTFLFVAAALFFGIFAIFGIPHSAPSTQDRVVTFLGTAFGSHGLYSLWVLTSNFITPEPKKPCNLKLAISGLGSTYLLCITATVLVVKIVVIEGPSTFWILAILCSLLILLVATHLSFLMCQTLKKEEDRCEHTSGTHPHSHG